MKMKKKLDKKGVEVAKPCVEKLTKVPAKACDKNAKTAKVDEQDVKDNITDLGTDVVPAVESDIHVITVIGQIEGHMVMSEQTKTTKYEHIIPQLVAVEESPEVKGLLLILNTVGGDVEAGLSVAEAVAGVSKPTVALILGGAHSIGIPIAVSADRTFIAKSASMTIHPVRMNGMVIGVHQSFEHFRKIQERIVGFVVEHSSVSDTDFRSLMLNTGELVSDVGTIVSGEEAVAIGLCDEVGTLSEALKCLHGMIAEE